MAKKHITLLAKSSSGNDFYDVDFYLEDNSIAAFCSCTAGENRILCKHVRGIVDGDESILYDKDQKKELQQIINHLPATAIPLLQSEVKKAETQLEESKRNLKKAKINFEKVLLGKLKSSSKEK